METNGSSRSVWMATAAMPLFQPLPGDTQASVCVIGAGIAGLTCAYLLSLEGKDVVLIDALGVGAGETGRTTAHFFPPDEWYAGLEKSFGADRTRMVAAGFAEATHRVEWIVGQEDIDCGFERLDGYLFARPENAFKALDLEYDAARRAGVAARLLPHVPDLAFDTGPCVRYPNLAQFHPLRYLAGLADAFIRRGGRIYGHTRALDVARSGAVRTVATNRGKVRASAVVVATNTPFNDRFVMHTKQAGYRTYVVGLSVPKNTVPRILLWDTGDPYYYVRLATPQPDFGRDVLIVGGSDRKVGQDVRPEDRWAEVEQWARQHFPLAEGIAYRWSGEVMEPADGLAYLGRNPLDGEGSYIITGDSGNGMTHCTLGAMIVTDLIMGRDNVWAELYDPARKAIHGLGDFVSEQANVLARYGEWLTRGQRESLEAIRPGEAAVVREGARKLAAYRDTEGELHVVSAKCSHLGCVVHWNSAERSWDCPCHGSRFGIDGEVLHGPAMMSLDAITPAEREKVKSSR